MSSDRLKSVSSSKSISRLFLQEELADVKFSFVENGGTKKFLPAHKLILASGSKVFQTMFFGSLPERKIVDIIDASYGEFEEFVQFFYLSDVKLTLKNSDGVARLADKYDMLNCLNGFVELAGVSESNSYRLWSYQMSVSLENQKFQKLFERKIRESPLETLESAEFLDCSLQTLQSILEVDDLRCNEIDIFTACIAWAKNSCSKNQLNKNISQNLRNELDDCFYLIRFGAMTREEVESLLSYKLYAGMFTSDERDEVIKITTDSSFKPTRFSRQPRHGPLLFQFNPNPLLCYMYTGFPLKAYYVKCQDYVLFESNVALSLGIIKFRNIFFRAEPSIEMTLPTIEQRFNKMFWEKDHTLDAQTFNIKITELDEPQLLLYGGSITYSPDGICPDLFLSNPVMIKSDKTYKIDISAINSFPSNLYHCYLGSTPSTSGMDDVKITIHSDPSQVSPDFTAMKMIESLNVKQF